MLKKCISVFFAVCLVLNFPGFYARTGNAITEGYLPRPAKDGRTVILHGDFSGNGADKSIIVIPSDRSGNSKTVSVGSNEHSSAGGWDSIEMDCFNKEHGYYKTTLRLKGNTNYQFKMEQKNSAGIKDVWYGLDGYMSRFDMDSFNGGSDANINLFLKHDDDVTFFFVDGDRGSFVEWQPEPPHQEYNQPGTKFHLISVSTKLRNNLNGLGGYNNIFDNYAGGKWRERDSFAPIWYSLTALPESGEITKDGADISATGELYLFRRTDAGSIGIYGKWQLDNSIEHPAADKHSDYWKNAGSFFSKPENAPKLRVSNPNKEDMSFALLYAADEKQPRHELNANNIVFEGRSKINAAGVYSYYLDELNLDGTQTDDAQNFILYPRHAAQSIFLPGIALDPVSWEAGKTDVTLSGQINGQNELHPEMNTVYVLITANYEKNAGQLAAHGFEKNGDKYQRVYKVTSGEKGTWNLKLQLPAGEYGAKVFADVFSQQLIDPLARNFSRDLYNVSGTDGINDLNTDSGYANSVYLEDFIESKNSGSLYSDFGKAIAEPGGQIYEVNAAGIAVAIGTGFSAPYEDGTGTHTRSTTLDTTFVVNALSSHEIPPQTGDTGSIIIWSVLSAAALVTLITLTLSRVRRVNKK